MKSWAVLIWEAGRYRLTAPFFATEDEAIAEAQRVAGWEDPGTPILVANLTRRVEGTQQIHVSTMPFRANGLRGIQ